MFLIELIKAVLFGIVEGITEWLPISSTGHLILLQDFVQFKNQDPAFMEMFNVVIQLGAILAVVVIYFDKLYPFKPGKSPLEVRRTWQLWAKVAVKTATETTDAGVVKEVQKLEFLVRQSPASLNINSTNFRILFRNNIYNVTGITPLYDHNNYMKIEGEIRKAGASDDYS